MKLFLPPTPLNRSPPSTTPQITPHLPHPQTLPTYCSPSNHSHLSLTQATPHLPLPQTSPPTTPSQTTPHLPLPLTTPHLPPTTLYHSSLLLPQTTPPFCSLKPLPPTCCQIETMHNLQKDYPFISYCTVHCAGSYRF